MNSINILNQLLVLHSRSLAVYMLDSEPWVGPQEAAAKEAVEALGNSNLEYSDRFGELIMAEHGTPAAGEFLIQYTGYNDCALNFLLPIVKEEQRVAVQTIQYHIKQLDRDPLAKALAQEALGAAKAHLDALDELNG